MVGDSKLHETANHSFLLLLASFVGDRVYSFPVFSAYFCELLLSELDNYERSDIIKHRPNTMNRHGVSQCVSIHQCTILFLDVCIMQCCFACQLVSSSRPPTPPLQKSVTEVESNQLWLAMQAS